MDLFPRQTEAILWFKERSARKEDGLFEKSRDIGFTWMAGGYALHRWLFEPGYKATFGSRKGEYVDRIGDPDSIFEKIRMIYRSLPTWMLPRGFSVHAHDKHMLIENPELGCIIRGESGDDMGRGGRSTDYFIDEAAFIERAEKVEAATSANADCRIWGSSVNGNGNFFARKRNGGTLKPSQIFRFHWSDDPRKRDGVVVDEETGETVPWHISMRKKLETHVWASEYDIDYSASVEGICIPAKWVEAAKRLRTLVHVEPDKNGIAGGDVGGGGKGKSVVVARFGPIISPPKSWGDGDTINTANTMVDYCQELVLKGARKDKYVCKITSLHYDSVGVGKGVQDALKRRNSPGIIKNGVNVGQPPTDTRWPDGYTAKEKFANLKAEAWWNMRQAFKCSYELCLFLEGDEVNGIRHDVNKCAILPTEAGNPDVTILAAQLSLVKVESNEQGKIIIQSKKSLAKDGIASPDHADALALTYAGTSVVETWMKAFAQ